MEVLGCEVFAYGVALVPKLVTGEPPVLCVAVGAEFNVDVEGKFDEETDRDDCTSVATDAVGKAEVNKAETLNEDAHASRLRDFDMTCQQKHALALPMRE